MLTYVGTNHCLRNQYYHTKAAKHRLYSLPTWSFTRIF